MDAAQISPDRSDEDIAQAMRRIAARENTPTKYERYECAIGLFVNFLMVAIVSRIAAQFQDMFREMEVSLPPMTAALFMICNSIAAYPGVFAASMFAIMWVYDAIICKQQWRLDIMKPCLAILFFGGGMLVLTALFLPLTFRMG